VKRHFPGLGHVQLQKLLRTGQFRVDGKRVTASTRVQPGQTVRVPPVDAEKPAVRRGPSEADTRFIRGLVIHDDDEVVVLNKPAGLAVQGGSKTTRHIDGMLDAWPREGSGRSWCTGSTATPAGSWSWPATPWWPAS
jgi:23S rRNA pseudouridine955/2504/2580 synthase